MSIINGNTLLVSSEGYQISRSLRFNSADSAYLNRTPASAGNRKTWTLSAWVKRANISNDSYIFSTLTGTLGEFSHYFYFNANGKLYIQDYTNNGNNNYIFVTTQVFRDASAWYHIIFALDTTQATSTNRVKLYINGSQVSAFDTASYPSLNLDGWVNTGSYAHHIGKSPTTSYSNGYLTEINFIDGQALTPSSFGETDAVTGVWKPKKYAGTYGTNGFYLNFSDNSGITATTLGKDSSGNSNNWTPNNFSVTAGAGNDSLIDTPTPYADGGNGRGNYATLNPLWKGANITPTNGNLENPLSSGSPNAAMSTMPMSTGKWYAEMENTATYANVGICFLAANLTAPTFTIGITAQTGLWEWYDNGSGVYSTSDGAAFTASLRASTFLTAGTIQFAMDCDNGKFWIGRNNTWYNSTGGTTGDPATGANPTFTISTSRAPFNMAAGSNSATTSQIWNFGQRAFAYTPPSGFKALNTQNLPDPTIKKPSSYFDVKTWTATGTDPLVISGMGFSPDLVWAKARSDSYNHVLVDAVRGANDVLSSNLTNAAATYTTVTQFNSDGFNAGGTTNNNYSLNCTVNSSRTYVAWCWDESATPGFDIVTYTGTGSATTVNHSLGVAPSMIIVKSRTSAVRDWPVYHSSVGNTQYAILNGTGAFSSASTFWNNTSPTSTVFSVGTAGAVNASAENFVAYLWSEVAGFSKFGSYTGNNSTDGPFVHCGFAPKWIMMKSSTNATTPWQIFDSVRETGNTIEQTLIANGSNAEPYDTASPVDFLSNGFKLRGSASSYNNYNTGTWIFAAFAETPAKYSLAR